MILGNLLKATENMLRKEKNKQAEEAPNPKQGCRL